MRSLERETDSMMFRSAAPALSARAMPCFASSAPERMGTDQVRQARFDEQGRMILKPPLRPYGQVTQQRTLVWERVG